MADLGTIFQNIYSGVKDSVSALFTSDDELIGVKKKVADSLLSDSSPEVTGFLQSASAQSAGRKGAGPLNLQSTQNALKNMGFTDKSIESFAKLASSENPTVTKSMLSAMRSVSASANKPTITLATADVPTATPRPRATRKRIYG
jgi:hypothetical protein